MWMKEPKRLFYWNSSMIRREKETNLILLKRALNHYDNLEMEILDEKIAEVTNFNRRWKYFMKEQRKRPSGGT